LGRRRQLGCEVSLFSACFIGPNRVYTGTPLLSGCYARNAQSCSCRGPLRSFESIVSTTYRFATHNPAHHRYTTEASGLHGHVLSYTCLACQTIRRIPAPAEPRKALEPTTSNASSGRHHGSEGMEDILTDTAIVGTSAGEDAFQPSQKKRKAPVTRLPPFFARKDAGHIVFRGNERLA
jgi:hypothetical protein